MLPVYICQNCQCIALPLTETGEDQHPYGDGYASESWVELLGSDCCKASLFREGDPDETEVTIYDIPASSYT